MSALLAAPVANARGLRYDAAVSFLMALIASVVESDAALAARIASGDEKALRRAFDRLGGRVRAIGLRVLGRAAEADDVVQDTFLEVWRRAVEFDPERGSFAVWVTVMAHHRAIDRLRRRGTRPVGDALDTSAPMVASSDPHASAVEAQVRDRIGQALDSLGEDVRVPIEMMYYRGLSQREVADELGVALGTLKSRVRAGMMRLSRLLGGLAEGEP